MYIPLNLYDFFDFIAELSIETVTVHQSDTNESCESSTSNNNQDNDVIPKSVSDIEPSEPGIFQIDSDKEKLVGEDDCSSPEVEGDTKKWTCKVKHPWKWNGTDQYDGKADTSQWGDRRSGPGHFGSVRQG